MQRLLASNNPSPPNADVFSKKSALIPFFLLSDTKREPFSINQISRELNLSPGTVHRVIASLEYEGVIRSHGLKTNKRFTLENPKDLLKQWLLAYQFRKKVKIRQFAISDHREFQRVRSKMTHNEIIPALHTAARDLFRSGVTNLKTFEYYVPNWHLVSHIRETLALFEQERGYDVLMLQPYYAGLIEHYKHSDPHEHWRRAYGLLTFLDLYHFPLRGREQAEVLFRRIPTLSKICRWSEIEDIGS